jgi:hypothetical protein
MVKARWTIPINMRLEDKPVLDAALNIAKEEGTNITKIFRRALYEFVGRKVESSGMKKMDEFLDRSSMSDPIFNRVLTPKELRNWPEVDLVSAAKQIRARKEELDSELRRRGFYFKW